MADITLKRGSAETITFTVTDSDGTNVDLSTATLTFAVKRKPSDSTALITIENASFGGTRASGIVTVDLSSSDTDLTGKECVGELKAEYSPTNIKKIPASGYIMIDFEESVT